MPQSVPGGKANPFYYIAAFAKYPGWLEIVAGIGGGLCWTIFTLFSQTDVADRPAMAYTMFAVPGAWEFLGALLASFHGYALANHSPRLRAFAMALTTAFWFNLTYGIVLGQLFMGLPIPATILGCLLCSVISFIVTVRLWKRYQ